MNVELTITSPGLDAGEITRRLEMEPSRAFASRTQRDGRPTGERVHVWQWWPARSVPQEFDAQLYAL